MLDDLLLALRVVMARQTPEGRRELEQLLARTEAKAAA